MLHICQILSLSPVAKNQDCTVSSSQFEYVSSVNYPQYLSLIYPEKHSEVPLIILAPRAASVILKPSSQFRCMRYP